MDAAKAVWRSVQHWGHLVLEVLTLTTFAPPPFNAVGIAAAASNATWHVIDGDYAMAGLALAAVVPGLAFVKIAKGVKAGAAAEKAAAGADDVAKAVKEIRAGAPVAAQRMNPSVATKAKIREAAPKTAGGDFIDPNTGQVVRRDGPFHYGHKPGHEWRCIKEKAARLGWTAEQLKEYANDPSLYQIEDPSSNTSHRHEADSCTR